MIEINVNEQFDITRVGMKPNWFLDTVWYTPEEIFSIKNLLIIL